MVNPLEAWCRTSVSSSRYLGEVSTGLMLAENVSFSPGSLYNEFEARLKDANSKHARGTMKPEEFARKVVSQVIVKKTGRGVGEHLWQETNAWLVWFLSAIGPRRVFDSTCEGMVGLNEKTLRQSLVERAEETKA